LLNIELMIAGVSDYIVNIFENSLSIQSSYGAPNLHRTLPLPYITNSMRVREHDFYKNIS